ncbi:unnamed protein product [Phaeothamnion confervicola]
MARLQQFAAALNIERVLAYHAILSVIIGGLAFVLPHNLISSVFTVAAGEKHYSHSSHELLRLYGALTLGSGYLALRGRGLADGRVRRCLAEAYAVSYGLQAAALLRAHMTAPDKHSSLNAIAIWILGSLSGFYGYCRWWRTIKIFELPGERTKGGS